MTILLDLRLDTGWICDAGEGELACRAGFWLDSLDVCAQYRLYLRDIGQPCRLKLGVLTTDIDIGGAELDVTEYVMLEDNLLLLTWADVDGATQPPIGAVWLQAVTCEDEADGPLSD